MDTLKILRQVDYTPVCLDDLSVANSSLETLERVVIIFDQAPVADDT